MKPHRQLSADELVAHAAFVRVVARRIVGATAEADDVAQETLLALWQRDAPTTGRRAWLTAIVRNLARLSWRRDTRRQHRERAVALRECEPLPEEAVTRAEWQQRIADEVAKLPEAECTTIVLRYYDGLSAADVAHRLGVTPTTVRNRCRRALARMRARLHRHHGAAWMPALVALAAMPKRLAAATIGGTSIMTTKIAIPAAIAACVLTGGGALFLLANPEGDATARTDVAQKHRANPVAQEPEGKEPDGGAKAPENKEVGREKPKESLADAVARYLRRVRDGKDANEVMMIGNELAKLDTEWGWAILAALHKQVGDARARRSVLNGFWGRLDDKGRPTPHAHDFDVLDLYVTDKDPANRSIGFRRVKMYSFEDFSAAPDRYVQWRETLKRTSLAAAIKQCARTFVQRLGDLGYEKGMAELAEEHPPSWLSTAKTGVDIPAALRVAGFLDRARAWIKPPRALTPKTEQDWLEARAVEPLWRWVIAIRADDAFLKAVVAPILDAPESYGLIHADHAVQLLGKSKPAWGFDKLAPLLAREPFRPMAWTTAFAMFRLGGKRAVPYLIAAVAAVDDPEFTKRICSGGLSHLTKLFHRDRPKSGAWWLRWWDANKHKLPPEIAAIDPHAIEFVR